MNTGEPMERLARLEAQIEALSRRVDESRADMRRISDKLDRIATQHEAAKSELRRIWMIIVAAATLISNGAQALLTQLFGRN